MWWCWLGVMAGGKEEKDARIEAIASSIRVVPNFPKPGLLLLLLFLFEIVDLFGCETGKA